MFAPGKSSSQIGITGPETFLFADLCGFTEYTARHGDALAADLAIGFHRRVGELAAEEGCSIVKVIGDEVMVHSGDCRRAVRLACRILALSKLDGYPPIRIGIDSGPAVRREGDWYGSTVNAAARVRAAATPGELLITERARSAVGDSDTIRVVPRGVREFKGLPASAVHAAVAA
ncbi:MAG: adenylate cyclase [Solirubrobacteraceae bacterium]|jgi:class 3 adenylate cyclase|nr:adenylate cyclase [Solirubrobacteraceae bacterium]